MTSTGPAPVTGGTIGLTLSPAACDEWPMTCWTPPEDEILAHTLWEAACDAVWALVGRRVGVCSHEAWVAMPLAETCLPAPYRVGREWVNATPGYDCCRLTLPIGPVVSVESVTIDGFAFTGWQLF